MIIKPYQPDMILEVASLFEIVFNGPPWNEEWRTGDAQERIHRIMDGQYSEGFTGWDESTLLAVLLGRLERWHEQDTFSIMEMFVRNQGVGFGSELLVYAQDKLAIRGVTRLFLTTAKDVRAADFYRKHGFIEHARLAHFGKHLSP